MNGVSNKILKFLSNTSFGKFVMNHVSFLNDLQFIICNINTPMNARIGEDEKWGEI